MQLSIRMQAVADMVTPGNRVADIGTDHAYIPCYLLQKKIVPSAIAMDVRKGPLERAEASINKYGLSDFIELRLSDGLHKLEDNEADTVIVAGMGGLLMIRILTEGLKVLENVSEIILQPQSDIREMRQWLHEHHFKIIDENAVLDDGKYYMMMKVVHGEDTEYDELQLRYGKILTEKKNVFLRDFLMREYNLTLDIIHNLKEQTSEKCQERLKQMMIEESYIQMELERLK